MRKSDRMEIFDNVNKIVKTDLERTITEGSRVSIAAACFSIHAYHALKEQLDGIDELRFIFTSPAFVAEKPSKEKREFYIPRLSRERGLYGTEFEVKLRNELTQKAIARECAEWIRKKAKFRSNVTSGDMDSLLDVACGGDGFSYTPMDGFTTSELGLERGNHIARSVIKFQHSESRQLIESFEKIWSDKSLLEDVTGEVLESITVAYRENPPDFLYFVALYNIFSEFLEDLSEDVLPNEATGFKKSAIWNMLYSFQKDAALAIINKLEKYNGCILADSVGLGKTFTALAVIKYYETRNRSTLVLCPKKLSDNWCTFKENYVNNPVAKDRLNYAVLHHTDLSRTRGVSNGVRLDQLNWGTYDLVVIDESHNFRNGGDVYGEDERENRYLRLLNKVIKAGVKTKVLMLSATPVNNRFIDLRNQLRLAYEGDSSDIDGKLGTSKPMDEVFRNAQRAFNEWNDGAPEKRTTSELLKKLDFDFFEVLDSVTIARSRRHIERYYGGSGVGAFPKRLKPISLRPSLTDVEGAASYDQIYKLLTRLNLYVYMPTKYVFPSKQDKYIDTAVNINRVGREQGIRRLTSINLLKRLESSVHSFRLTLGRIGALIDDTIGWIDAYEAGRAGEIEAVDMGGAEDFDYDDQNTELFAAARRMKIDLEDMDYVSWRNELKADSETIGLLREMVEGITPERDAKLQALLGLVSEKIENPINGDNRKILIFSAFSDTAEYIYDNVGAFVKRRYGLDTAMITGSTDGKTTIPRFHATFNNVLTCFSPLSKDKALLMPGSKDSIDVLVGTDCISEGQNLQDCDFCVNYDIHWNPVRIIQRFGRIDRIGSRNESIQLVNFWPDLTLDDYINLKGRVEARMRISVMASTGDDDPINVEEKGDLEYRKAQLKRLQEEVVDIEDMSSGISIMDLGLNEFRLDLLDYIKAGGDIEKTPFGLHAVVPSSEGMPPGAIFVLKNVNEGVDADRRNRLHPFYMVYVSDDGGLVADHLSPKEILDRLRLLCKGRSSPDKGLCSAFNRDTRDGRDMRKYSSLLGDAVRSVIDAKERSDIDSLFRGGGTSALGARIEGLDDFELVCFFAVREGGR
jgi:SNF2 family DNA or RNA helicase